MGAISEPSSDDFDLQILSQIEKLFGDEDLETLFEPPSLTSEGRLDRTRMAVLVKHLPSGKQTDCGKYPSQVRNKIWCLLTLLLDTPRLP